MFGDQFYDLVKIFREHRQRNCRSFDTPLEGAYISNFVQIASMSNKSQSYNWCHFKSIASLIIGLLFILQFSRRYFMATSVVHQMTGTFEFTSSNLSYLWNSLMMQKLTAKLSFCLPYYSVKSSNFLVLTFYMTNIKTSHHRNIASEKTLKFIRSIWL